MSTELENVVLEGNADEALAEYDDVEEDLDADDAE